MKEVPFKVKEQVSAVNKHKNDHILTFGRNITSTVNTLNKIYINGKLFGGYSLILYDNHATTFEYFQEIHFS